MQRVESTNSLKRSMSRSEQINTLDPINLNALLKKQEGKKLYPHLDKIHKEADYLKRSNPPLPDWRDTFKLVLRRIHKITGIEGSHVLSAAILYTFLANGNESLKSLQIGKLQLPQMIMFVGQCFIILWFLIKKSSRLRRGVSLLFLISAYAYYLKQALYLKQ